MYDRLDASCVTRKRAWHESRLRCFRGRNQEVTSLGRVGTQHYVHQYGQKVVSALRQAAVCEMGVPFCEMVMVLDERLVAI